MYDPLIGRFISPDSIVPDWYDPQSLNRYSYCRNNPLKYTDPDGNFAVSGFAVAAYAFVTETAFGGYLATHVLGTIVAWTGLELSAHLIGNPSINADDPTYQLSDFTEDISLAVGAIGIGIAAKVEAIKMTVIVAPMVAAYETAHPGALEDIIKSILTDDPPTTPEGTTVNATKEIIKKIKEKIEEERENKRQEKSDTQSNELDDSSKDKNGGERSTDSNKDSDGAKDDDHVRQ